MVVSPQYISFEASTDRELLIQAVTTLNQLCGTLPEMRKRMEHMDSVLHDHEARLMQLGALRPNTQVTVSEAGSVVFNMSRRTAIKWLAILIGIGALVGTMFGGLGDRLNLWNKIVGG